MAFASDTDSSEKGAAAAARTQNRAATVANASASSQPLHQSSQEHSSQASESSARDLPLSQRSDGELALPDDWAGDHARRLLQEEGVNLSDFSLSEFDSDDSSPLRSPARPGITRQNSLTNGRPPPLVRQRSIERVVATRNMMNHQRAAQGQQPQLPHQHPQQSAMSGAVAYHGYDLLASPQPQAQAQRQPYEPTLPVIEGSPTGGGQSHIGGYAGMTMPPIVMPSTSGTGFGRAPPVEVKSEPFDSSVAPGVAPGFPVTGSFDVKIYLPLDAANKSSTYEWGELTDRLYAEWKTSVPLNVFVPNPTAFYLLRARLLFADDHTPVERCADCRSGSAWDADPHPGHVVRFDGNEATYDDGPDRSVQCVLKPLEGGSTATRVLVKFWCRNSCDKSNSKRDRVLHVELLSPATLEVLDFKAISVRVCASPSRDYTNDLVNRGKKKKRRLVKTEASVEEDESSSVAKKPKSSCEDPTEESGCTDAQTKKKHTGMYVRELRNEEVDVYVPEDGTPAEKAAWRTMAIALHFKKYSQECVPKAWERFEKQILPYIL